MLTCNHLVTDNAEDADADQFSKCAGSVDYPWSEETTTPAHPNFSNVVNDPVRTARDVSCTQNHDANAGASQHDESSSAADNSIHVAGNEPLTQDQAGSTDAGERDEAPSTVDDPDQIAGIEPRTQDNTDAGRRERSQSAARDPTHTLGDTSRAQGQDANAGASQRNDISEQSSHTLQTEPSGDNERADNAEQKVGPSGEPVCAVGDDKKDLSQFLARHYFDCIAGTSTGGYVNLSRLT